MTDKDEVGVLLLLHSPIIHACLRHQICDVLLQIIDAATHVINSRDDLVGHGLEFVLHLLEQVLDESCQILDIFRIGCVAEIFSNISHL